MRLTLFLFSPVFLTFSTEYVFVSNKEVGGSIKEKVWGDELSLVCEP